MFTSPSPTTPASPLDLRVVAVLSLLLSAWLIAIDPVITRDAIIYLRSADAYLQQGIFASQQTFGRPLLPLCIATVHQLTGLSLLHAGLLLSTLFYALMSCAFVAIVRLLGGGRKVQIFAAIVILAHPLLAESRSSIMRDPAYWAMLLLAFRQLLLYTREPAIRHQLGWFCTMILAVLFRFEGLFFALLAPLGLLLVPGPQSRLRSCLCLLLPQLLVFAALLTAAAGYQYFNPDQRLFPDIGKYYDRLLGLTEEWQGVAAGTGEAMLKFSAREDAGFATAAGLLAILLLNLCRALTWPWLVALLWGYWRKLIPGRIAPRDAALINVHLLISLLYLGLFTLLNQFVLERYCGIFTLFAMLYLPFLLGTLWQREGHKLSKTVVAALLVVMCGDTLHNGNYQKVFVRDAAQWLERETPTGASLITNDRYVAYFSRRDVEWTRGKPSNYRFDAATLRAQPQQADGFDYLAIRLKRREIADWEAFLREQQLAEIAVFDGGQHGRVSVVSLHQKP